MAKKTKKTAAKNGSKETPQGAAMAQEAPEGAQFGILVQFVKDISFESPNAPMSLQAPGENPKLGVNVQVSAMKRGNWRQALEHGGQLEEQLDGGKL